MKLAAALLAIAMAVALGGCVVGKPKTAKAAPPPPKPAAASAPAPPREPLSVPQTNVKLPPPQPVPPEAIAAALPADEPAPAPAPSRTPRSQRPGGTPTRTEPPAPVPAPIGPPTPPAAEPDRPPLTELTPAAELKRLQDEAEARKNEVGQLIARIPRSRLNQQRGTVARIQSFLKQADEAMRAGNMKQASELAGRALVLARELK